MAFLTQVHPEWSRRRVRAMLEDDLAAEQAVIAEGYALPDLTEEHRAQVAFYEFLMYVRHGDAAGAEAASRRILEFDQEGSAFFEVPNAFWSRLDDPERALRFLDEVLPTGLTLEGLVEQWNEWILLLLLKREIEIVSGRDPDASIEAFVLAYRDLRPRRCPLIRLHEHLAANQDRRARELKPFVPRKRK